MTTAPAVCPLRPLEDRVVARGLSGPVPERGELWLPHREGQPTWAEVIAVGPGRVTDYAAVIPPPAVVGDVVVLAEHGPTEIDVDGETLLCAHPSVVLAVQVPGGDD